MIKYLTIILILGTFAQSQQAGNAIDGFVKEALKSAAQGAIGALFPYSAFLESAKIVLTLFGVAISDENENANTNNKITASLDSINVKLDVLSKNMLDFEQELSEKMNTDDQHRDLKIALNDFHKQIKIIDYFYEEYLNMMNESIVPSKVKYNAFLSSLQSFSDFGVRYPLNNLHTILSDVHLSTRKNVPMYYADVPGLSRLLMCQSQQSAQRLIFNFYELIIINEMKGTLLMNFAYKDLVKENNAADDLSVMANKRKDRLRKTLLSIKSTAARALREVWACDPKDHIIGTTYDTVGPIFQKFVMFKGDVVEYPSYARDVDVVDSHNNFRYFPFAQNNEINRIHKKICSSNTCATIKREAPKYCYNFEVDNICRHYPMEKFTCRTEKGDIGSAIDCEPIEKELKICLEEQNDYRRYKTIDAGNKIYGKNETCNGEVHEAISRQRSGHDCDYCLCTCEQDYHPRAKAFVSIKNVLSDVGENQIITGVKIVHDQNVFQILIKEGKLLGNGVVDRDTITRWKIADVAREYGKDYIKITWDHRTFLLDDLEGPEGHVLTGIRFEADGNSDIKLAIQTMPFNLTSGKLQIDEPLWSNNPNTTAQRKELKLPKYEVPTLYHEHKVDSESNQFIRLTTSDMQQDIGQSVVPFFDLQPVLSTYPMPLSGAGFVHKGYRNSAGFLALKVITFDINRLIPKDSDL